MPKRQHHDTSSTAALVVIPDSAAFRLVVRGTEALARARTIPEVKYVRNAAEAVRVWLRLQRADHHAIIQAAALKLRATHKLGGLLKEMPKHPGVRGVPGIKAGTRPLRREGALPLRLEDLGVDDVASHRWQTIATLPEARIDEYLKACEPGDVEPTTTGAYRLARGQTIPRILSSEVHEWNTPAAYVDAARAVLGAIDLDPASSEAANRTVKALRYYTVEEDGLAQPWAGRVWLNPPWGKVGPLFIARLLDEYQAGRVTAAILLVNAHCTDTSWFQPLWDHLLCFADHRIDFTREDGEIGQASTHGSVFVYFGDAPERFAETFRAFGAVVRRWPPP